jgi:Putative Flp pilus-assembly TadE/G-like
MLPRLAANPRGNMTILMAGAVAVAGIIFSGVLDYMSVTNQRHSLQDVADRAALAAAQELIVFSGTDARVSSVAQAFVTANYKPPSTTHANIADDGHAVTVNIEAPARTFFPGPISERVKTIKADATAEISGGGYICMIGLDRNSVATINMMNRARLTATNCAIYSNSISSKSLWLHDTARVRADLVCVAGGIQGPLEAFTLNPPTEDCPPVDDPLRDRPKPAIDIDDCDHHNEMVTPFKTVVLKPGVYCGGLSVVGGVAKLQPGAYVMRNGLLSVSGGGTLSGENVGFFLTGSASTILFARDSHISLTAPKTGDMAGLLFFEDRDSEFATYHRITSNDARNLVGTMYFPNSKLLIDATNPVADRSDYTVIVAREFELRDGPELVLNTDYESSPIPLPEGVGNKTNSNIRLVN